MTHRKPPSTHATERAQVIADMMLLHVVVIIEKLHRHAIMEKPEDAPDIVEIVIGAIGSTMYKTIHNITSEGRTPTAKAIHAALTELKEKKRKPATPHHIDNN